MIDRLKIGDKYKRWLKGISDLDVNHPSIEFFCNKHKNLSDKIPVEYRDIFKFKTISEFISYIDDINSDSDTERKIKSDGSITIYEDENFLIKRIYSFECMNLYGKGSKWCIASDDRKIWDRYITEGSLFYLCFSKKLPYTSQFNKFIVQLTKEGVILMWDREDNSYKSNIFDLIHINKNIFIENKDKNLINKLISRIDKPVLDILVKNNAIIAGGALTSILNNTKINDFDIWFKNKLDYNSAIGEMNVLFKQTNNLNVSVVSESKVLTTNSITYITPTKTKYQIILDTRYEQGDIETIVNQFDFTCVMCGVDLGNSRIYYNERFIIDNVNKMIVINSQTRSKLGILNRIIKYTKKGYRTNLKSQKGILKVLSELSLDDIDQMNISDIGLY